MPSLSYLLVNFGGPRDLNEIKPFLCTLLTDKDVVRTQLPTLLHRFLFRRIAKKRAIKIRNDYALIGGKSPIYEDTEAVAGALQEMAKTPVSTFHRYLSATHRESCRELEQSESQEIRVFPMFPQFTYATTGSIARFFSKYLNKKTIQKLRWVKSYPNHPAFITLTQASIRECLEKNQLEERDTFFLFSAHGLPQMFVDQGDPYLFECLSSFEGVMAGFPNVQGALSFQSKFGPGEWLRPYTIDVCQQIKSWAPKKKQVLFIPISFTSDHIETLFEIEKLYMPLIFKQGMDAYRLPAFNRREDWIASIAKILDDAPPVANAMLIRH